MSRIPCDGWCYVFSNFSKRKMGESYVYGLQILYHKISKLYISSSAQVFTPIFFNELALVIIDFRGGGTVVVLDMWSMRPSHS